VDIRTAAQHYGVTESTVRGWCRSGRIEAVKTASRRWDIIVSSSVPEPTIRREMTVESMLEIGGTRWTKGGHDRVYLDWSKLVGLEVEHYRTGNISYAEYKGERISNSQAYQMCSQIDRVWFDCVTGELCHTRFGRDSRIISSDDLWEEIKTSIDARILAL